MKICKNVNTLLMKIKGFFSNLDYDHLCILLKITICNESSKIVKEPYNIYLFTHTNTVGSKKPFGQIHSGYTKLLQSRASSTLAQEYAHQLKSSATQFDVDKSVV